MVLSVHAGVSSIIIDCITTCFSAGFPSLSFVCSSFVMVISMQ